MELGGNPYLLLSFMKPDLKETCKIVKQFCSSHYFSFWKKINFLQNILFVLICNGFMILTFKCVHKLQVFSM